MSTRTFRDAIRGICSTERLIEDIPHPETRTPVPEEISRTRSIVASNAQAARRKLPAPARKARGRARKPQGDQT